MTALEGAIGIVYRELLNEFHRAHRAANVPRRETVDQTMRALERLWPDAVEKFKESL